MKREARVLFSHCEGRLCGALVVRGRGFDALLLAMSCEELCERAKKKGYMEELRYQLGDCDCGLPQPPRRVHVSRAFLEEAVGSALRLISLHRRAMGDRDG